VSQPSVNRSLGDSNSRSDISSFQPLVMKFNELCVSIQLLSASSDASLFLAARANWVPFFFRYGLRLSSLWRRLYVQATSDFGPTASQQRRDTVG